MCLERDTVHAKEKFRGVMGMISGKQNMVEPSAKPISIRKSVGHVDNLTSRDFGQIL